MTFELDSVHYRIVFQHDRPRDWTSHIGHQLPLPLGLGEAFIPLVSALERSAITIDKDGLYCRRCHVRLAGIGPAIARKLAVPAISGLGARLVADNHRRVVDREYARNVRCTIYRGEGDDRVSVYSGNSKLNTDAGDHYDREKGRIAALRDALPKRDPGGQIAGIAEIEDFQKREEWRAAFCQAAMDAYLIRKSVAYYRARAEGRR